MTSLENIEQQLEKWQKVRKYASIAMLVGFICVVIGYFLLKYMYPMLAIWFFTVIVPHIIHTIAGRKIRKLQKQH